MRGMFLSYHPDDADRFELRRETHDVNRGPYWALQLGDVHLFPTDQQMEGLAAMLAYCRQIGQQLEPDGPSKRSLRQMLHLIASELDVADEYSATNPVTLTRGCRAAISKLRELERRVASDL